ncbi:hypothetical protein CCM_08118 [Cordyceps militaris CM01]|uniref:Uncharacterized protein n=1 Tax=Cordyceps militaris (strain CM01) TaxID=983644 RepID=G3JNM5_CORMM|nr:uncharacterized protein CCM_08118 [Cordyceps militaris CM01]EGX89865.1 hypothetical protein CCM_08118 [Cordyceps militaris CM01]
MPDDKTTTTSTSTTTGATTASTGTTSTTTTTTAAASTNAYTSDTAGLREMVVNRDPDLMRCLAKGERDRAARLRWYEKSPPPRQKGPSYKYTTVRNLFGRCIKAEPALHVKKSYSLGGKTDKIGQGHFFGMRQSGRAGEIHSVPEQELAEF